MGGFAQSRRVARAVVGREFTCRYGQWSGIKMPWEVQVGFPL